jgi:hypothetical protein
MTKSEKTREPGMGGTKTSPKLPESGAPKDRNLELEETAMTPKSSEPGPSPAVLETHGAQKLPTSFRKLLATTPEKEWPKIRAFLIESEEAGELVDMLPDMTRVMKYCPARLMGMVGKRQITGEQLDKAYTQLHDSLHGVRQALYTLLHLAGLLETRPEVGAASRTPAEASEPEPGPPAGAPRSKPVLAT